ncbi:hypothetical protein [Parathalassolituus penaei]|uniref:Uncharacterized protein n=1 Tax=Parathalassolituus penaei TaxID=2997323 RepID=A0A9X3ER22_9GAMM|nr:hypothetical protein [Parathalassolituus penaei]MCY0967333.1 hypothetical protein [Parathalassolituus penaei]
MSEEADLIAWQATPETGDTASTPFRNTCKEQVAATLSNIGEIEKDSV